jgi:hypothetical protein
MASPSKRLKVFAIVVGATLGVVVLTAGVAVVVHAAWQAARRLQYSNNMKQVGLGLLNFESVYGRLPPTVHRDKAGRPLCSWRLRLVPFMEGIMREIEYGQRWDAPANQWLSKSPWPLFCWLPGENGLHTNVVAITGRGTAFEESRVVRLKDIAPDTILAIEIAKSSIRWAEPGDLGIGDIPESITCGVDGGGVHVIFADGAVWFLRADVPLGELRKFFTIEGGKRYRREEVLRPYAIDGK